MKTILIIDDQEIELRKIRAIIEEYLPGTNIYTAKSGKEGMAIALASLPDTILLDVIMPGMDGFTTCRMIRLEEELKNTPIIMLSAVENDTKSRIKALEFGAEAFLAKPYNVGELIAMIKVMLRIKASEDDLNKNLKELDLSKKRDKRESKRHYKSLFDHASFPIWKMDLTKMRNYLGKQVAIDEDNLIRFFEEKPEELRNCLQKIKTVEINTAGLKSFLINKSDPAGLVIVNHIESSSFPVLKNALIALISGKPEYEGTVIFNGKHKNLRNLFFRCTIDTKSQDTLSSVLVSFIDITQNIATHKELKSTTAFLETVFDNVTDQIMVIDAKSYIILMANQSFLDTYGRTKNEVLGKKCYKITHNQNFPCKGLEHHCPLPDTMKTGKHELAEHIHVDKNGDKKYIEISTSPVKDEKGKIISVIHFERDITERKTSELIQKRILNIANAANAAKDLGELSRYIQLETSHLMDTENFAVALYDNKTDSLQLLYIKDKKDEIPLNIPLRGTLSSLVIKSNKSRLITKDDILKLHQKGEIELVGSIPEIWLGVPLFVKKELSGIVIVQNYQNPKAYTKYDLGVLEIISHQISLTLERKKNEQDLLQAMLHAQESDRLKSSFLASMSHELRTPLNAVIGYSSLFDKDMDSDEVLDFAEKINNGGNNLLNIVEDIFILSLLDSGQEKPIYKMFALNDLFSEVNEEVLSLQQRKEKQNVEICMIPFSQNGVGFMESDYEGIKQIFMRLLNNALKFTMAGTVSFGAEYIEKNYGKEWRFFVKDTGVGIPEKHMGFIFDRFRMGDDSDTRLFDGLGIGLFVAKSLTELLDGRIWVESVEGMGSTFYFAFADHVKTTI